VDRTLSRALNIFQGKFGRVALLDMDRSLVTHAHHACHVLLKFGGADTAFHVRGEICPLTDDTAVLVNAWEPHAYAHGFAAPQTIILALYIDPRWLARIDHQLICSGHAHFFPRQCVALNREILDRARNLGAQMLIGETLSAHEAEETVFDLMISVIDSFSNRMVLKNERSPVSIADHRIRRAIEVMRAEVGHSLDITRLCRVASLSRPHFFHRFKAVTGLTPSLFLNTLRMEQAAVMLVDSTRTLIDVAQDLGFDAHSNFTRFFRQHQGVTPSEYRRVTQYFG
jgi:AraC family transcriptional regulator